MNIWGADQTGSIAVTVADQGRLLDDLGAHFDAGRGFSVATLNLDHAVKLRRDTAFRTAYAAQTHVTADGNPVVWLSRLSGQGDVSLVPGSELIDPLAALAARKAVPVALFGASDGALDAAATALEAAHPGLDVVLRLAPPMGFDPQGQTADAAIEKIGASGAGLVFVALGAPKQEIFAARAQAALPKAGFVSIGAGLDFISGDQTRAPKWVRALAGEWLWRLFGNPRRLAGRYAACVVILPGLTWRALAIRRGKSTQP